MDTQICNNCNEEKLIDDFNWRNKERGIKHKRCKICTRKQGQSSYNKNADYYRKKNGKLRDEKTSKNKIKIWNYLIEHPCVDCGESNPILLDFDHVRGNKIYNVSQMKAMLWSTILKEIEEQKI